MNSIFKRFVLQPVEEGYIPNEVVDDNYQMKDGEILLSIEEKLNKSKLKNNNIANRDIIESIKNNNFKLF